MAKDPRDQQRTDAERIPDDRPRRLDTDIDPTDEDIEIDDDELEDDDLDDEDLEEV